LNAAVYCAEVRGVSRRSDQKTYATRMLSQILESGLGDISDVSQRYTEWDTHRE
jgi:hypothetical protein